MSEPEVLECPLMGIEAAMKLVALILLNKDPASDDNAVIKDAIRYAIDNDGTASIKAMRLTVRYCIKEKCEFWVPEKKQCAVRAVFNKCI